MTLPNAVPCATSWHVYFITCSKTKTKVTGQKESFAILLILTSEVGSVGKAVAATFWTVREDNILFQLGGKGGCGVEHKKLLCTRPGLASGIHHRGRCVVVGGLQMVSR